MTFLGIGMRTIKTGLSVLIIIVICTFVSQITGINSTGFYGAITAVICMQNLGQLTYQMGIERVVGSFVGAVVALTFFTLFGIPTTIIALALIVTLGTIIAIHATNILKIPFGSTVAAIMVISCFTVVPENAVALTVIVRCAETVLGVVVATLINNYIAPYNIKENV